MKTIIKTISYRVYSIVIAFVVFLILFGEVKTASGLTILFETIKTAQYYAFEKAYHYLDNRKT